MSKKRTCVDGYAYTIQQSRPQNTPDRHMKHQLTTHRKDKGEEWSGKQTKHTVSEISSIALIISAAGGIVEM